MGYTAYEISDESRQALLRAFPPRYGHVVAEHITVAFGVAASEALPPAADLAVIGYAHDGQGIEALVVSVNGETRRADGGMYHTTLSYDPDGRPPATLDAKAAAYRAVHSNPLIKKFGFTSVAPVPVEAAPRYLLTREEKAALAASSPPCPA